MAIIASASITLANIRDVKATYRYYKLQASTAAAPGKPTSISTLPPSGWSSTEPSYTAGSTNTLYTVDLTTFTDDTFSYSPVSVSSSYEAAKQAFNLAATAQKSAEEAAKTATNYLSYSETDGLIISEDASTADGWNTQIKSDGLHIRDGETSVADYGDGIKLYTPPDSNGNVTEAVAIDADGININKGKINLSAGESKIDQSCFSSTSADGKTSMYLNNYCVDFFRNETGAATTRLDEPFQEAVLNYDGLTLTDNAIQPDDSTYMKDLYITTDHMMYEEGSSQYWIYWLDLYKAINLTVKDLTSSVKGNLGGNTTAGNVGSFFSVVKIGKLVICSLNIQMKKNRTSKLAIISGLPKAAYPANGALSYNGYSSSVNVFIRAGEKIIYNDGTIPYDGYVEGQLIYITSE